MPRRYRGTAEKQSTQPNTKGCQPREMSAVKKKGGRGTDTCGESRSYKNSVGRDFHTQDDTLDLEVKSSTPGLQERKHTIKVQHEVPSEIGEQNTFVDSIDALHRWNIGSKDLDLLEKKLDIYKKLCIKYDEKIGNQSMYFALGLSPRAVNQWLDDPMTDDAHKEFAWRVKGICAVTRETMMANGTINTVAGIFWQKNYDGLRDVQEQVVHKDSEREQLPTIEALKEKYVSNNANKYIDQKDVDNDEESK